MGNSSAKESRDTSAPQSRPGNTRQSSAIFPSGPSSPLSNPQNRSNLPQNHRGRSARHDISFLGIGGISERDAAQQEVRKETRQEREARKAEKERITRARERERSMKEEAVDGGYLVTLGTYVGTEDFDKSGVRQLQIERRLAPFWRGLNDHSESWTEYQLVAAARGMPIPAPDEPPPEESSTAEAYSTEGISKPIAVSNTLAPGGNQNALSSSHPGFQSNQSPSSAPLFRGRSKTFASLASSRNNSQSEIAPQEIRLPHEPQINGQPVEAYLYKDVLECPICFLYYPPYLNKTRCCDQPICSECFVQIKRPDPHPPEHTDPNSPPPEPRPYEEEGLLVSEPAACPFCVQNEFGVTYEPPPFRRGLAYANQGQGSSMLAKTTSAMSSSSSLANQNSPGTTATTGMTTTRRRTQSLSASAPTVITTDRVRPDWAKKLSDARAQAARRSAAATALHTAAYMQGVPNELRFGLGRRRRPYMTMDSQGSSDTGTPQAAEGVSGPPHIEALLAALEGQGSSLRGPGRPGNDLFPGRTSSRGGRAEDLEELMMMEAIRQSLAAEEDRKKKEEKEARKEEKKKAKEQRKADKSARKNSLYPAGSNASSSFYSEPASSSTALDSPVEDGTKGKGRAVGSSNPATGFSPIGFNPLSEPTSTVNTERTASSEAQRYLETSRANLEVDGPSKNTARPRGASETSSNASSAMEQATGDSQSFDTERNVGDYSANSQQNENGSVQNEDAESAVAAGSGGSPLPSLNYQSLAEMIGLDGGNTDSGSSHGPETDNVGTPATLNTEARDEIIPAKKSTEVQQGEPAEQKNYNDAGLLKNEAAPERQITQ